MNTPDTFDDFIRGLTEHARSIEGRDPATSAIMHRAAGLLCHQSAALLRAEAARRQIADYARERGYHDVADRLAAMIDHYADDPAAD